MKLLLQFRSGKVSFFSKRNASIALMHLLIGLHEDRGVVEKLETLSLRAESSFSACLQHYQMFGDHLCCFNDIRRPISELTIVERDAYLQEVKDISKKASNILSCEVSTPTS